MRKEIRVLIAGRSPVIRLGLIQTLSREAGVTVVSEVDGLCDFVQVLTSVEPDVAIIENSFAKWETVDLLEELDDTSGIAIIVLSAAADSGYVETVLGAGAGGFLRSSESMECLLPAIRKVLSGGVYISHGLSREVLEGTEENGSRCCNGVDRLSEREFQIFELLGNGYDVNKIGEKLHIGTKTVEIHRRELILKLGISETNELTRRAITYVVQTHRLVSNA